MTKVTIRPATGNDANVFTDICFRSKSHWGYPLEYIELWTSELTISAEELARHMAFAAVDGTGSVVGFGILSTNPPLAEVEHLYVDPAAIREGVGRALLTRMFDQTLAGGCSAIELDSDPHALGFYLKMGGVQIGDTPSTVIPGRSLPRVRIEIASGH